MRGTVMSSPPLLPPARSGSLVALHWAIRWDKEDVVKLLLENGANVEAKDNDGDTALDVAKNEKIRELLEKAQKMPEPKPKSKSLFRRLRGRGGKKKSKRTKRKTRKTRKNK